MRNWVIFIGLSLLSLSIKAQNDSVFIRQLFTEALTKGKSHEDLRFLCKNIGARLSGSAEAQMAVEWAESRMKEYGFDNVYLQPIMVPHWERGTKEAAWIKGKDGQLKSVHILALGGSIGTNGLMRAPVVLFNSLDELRAAPANSCKGKIVFINQPMNAADIVTFTAYGGCYAIRGNGAIDAAKKGAIGVVIRSLAMPQDEFPHTGSMHYEKETAKIPAVAMATVDANYLADLLKQGPVEFTLEMDCRDYPDAPSFNVMGEIIGENPNEVITIGGHLDSWDTGEGAHDDGAGIVHCLEAIRLLKVLGYKPKHTIRVVCFMNEENGNQGGENYAKFVLTRKEKQVAAVESDRGGFSPRGFECDGSEAAMNLIKSFQNLLLPYGLYHLEKGYGGVDISPLKRAYPGIPLFGLVPDSQRYFDFHHAPSDVFEAVNKRELELGAASMAAFVYLLDLNIYKL